MKLTKESLKRIIKEELEAVTEGYWGSMYRDDMGRLQYGPDPRIRKEPKKEPKKPEETEDKGSEEKPVQEAGGKLMAYFNPSMMKGDTAVELQYNGMKIDFRYRFARPQYDPFKIQKAVQSLADGGKLGSINGLAEAIFDVLDRKMSSDKPTLEQIKNMPVYFG